MVSEERQRVMETNRSLRLIKNELESLLEKGVIADDAFDNIHQLLPTEASLSGGRTPTPRSRAPAAPAAPASPPTNSLENLSLNAPPSYSQSTGNSNSNENNDDKRGPPALPGRTPPPPSKPVIAHARAMYRYAASDAGDCSFERDDRIAVHQHMNPEWWMGRNLRTGQEGIFPRNYVEVEHDAASAVGPQPFPPPSAWQGRDEKGPPGGGYGYQPPPQPMYGGGPPPGMHHQHQQQWGYPQPPPPGQANPYNANAPPMAVAEQEGGGGGGGSGAGEAGKKIGKKLGNAAIFGAGATIGGNIVNSIF